MFAKNRKELKIYSNNKGETVENSAQNEKVFESVAQLAKELKSLGKDHAQAMGTERACWDFLNVGGCNECPTNVAGDTRSCSETIAHVTAERLEKILQKQDREPKPVHVGDVKPFPNVKPDKAQALKILEESAEVFGAWQEWEQAKDNYSKKRLFHEIADVMQACVNLLAAYNVENFHLYVQICEERNRARGRYGQI